MERLTVEVNNEIFYNDNRLNDYLGVDEMSVLDIINALRKLKTYEDAEEQGLLRRLPCKVGDTVWLTNHDRTVRKEKPMMCNVDEFTISDTDCYAILNANEPFYALHRFRAVNIKDFGKTVFLTREEAEKALEDMKGE